MEQHGTTFKRIPVRRGVTEGGYSQVTLRGTLDLSKVKVVVKGAFAVLSQLQARPPVAKRKVTAIECFCLTNMNQT